MLRRSIVIAAVSALLAGPALASTNPTAAAPAAPSAPRSIAWWTDAANLLAGQPMDAGSELRELAARPSVEQHRRAMAPVWQQFHQSRLDPAMRFARAEIAALPAAKGPVYYPFSGPDAMYALALFPDATAFALVGLEPVGDLPDVAKIDEASLAASLAEVRRSLNSLKAFSFFRTNDMRAEFGRNRFSGVTPILLLFIARHGYAVQAVQPVVMERDANLREVNASALRGLAADRVPGVQIRFVKAGEAQERTLYYFSADLSNTGLAKVPQPLVWAERFAPRVTYLKSASYLMHKSYFSNARDFILTHSAVVVQDDSGIPLRFFADAAWDRTFFGSYDGPIQLFANWYQKDLRSAYETQGKPLEFGIGYDFQAKTSNIQRFVKRTN
jgi:hypothetical protein